MKINMKKVYNIFALGALALLGYQSIQLRNLEKKYHEGLASLSEKIDNIGGFDDKRISKNANEEILWAIEKHAYHTHVTRTRADLTSLMTPANLKAKNTYQLSFPIYGHQVELTIKDNPPLGTAGAEDTTSVILSKGNKVDFRIIDYNSDGLYDSLSEMEVPRQAGFPHTPDCPEACQHFRTSDGRPESEKGHCEMAEHIYWGVIAPAKKPGLAR